MGASFATLNSWSQSESLLAYCYLEKYLFSSWVSRNIETDAQFLKGHYALMRKKKKKVNIMY